MLQKTDMANAIFRQITKNLKWTSIQLSQLKDNLNIIKAVKLFFDAGKQFKCV